VGIILRKGLAMGRGRTWDTRKETLLKACRPEKKEAAQRVCAAFYFESLMRQSSDNRRSPKAGLAVGHFLGHVEDEFAVPILHFAQQAAKLVEKACIFADASPGNVIGRLALRKIRQLRRFLTVIKELIEWALESASQLFQRFDGRDSMTILNA
jgi:hypothetical protein